MNFNRPIVTAPFVAPSFPGSGHTYVSCPHPSQLYLHNILLPKNGYPNRASFSNAETSEIASSMFDLLGAPSNLISTISAGSVQPNAHDQVEHSTPQLRTLYNYRWLVLLILLLLLPPHAKHENGTLAPKQCDTDNAIQCVITYENGCSLFTPFISMLRQQLVERIAVSGFISQTHTGPA